MNRRSQLLSDDRAALREALLRCARLDGPSAQARQRLMEGVAAAGVVSVGAGLIAASAVKQAGAVSTAKVGSLVVVKWALSGALAASATLGVREVALLNEDRAPREQPVVMEERTPGRRLQSGAHVAVAASSAGPMARVLPGEDPPALAPNVTSMAAPAPAETVHSSTPPPPRRATKKQTGKPKVPPIAPTVGASSDQGGAIAPPVGSITVGLSHELALLERTRAYLAQQAPMSALDVLGDYERSFPSGALRIEAWALRVEAMAAAGQSGKRRFLRAPPLGASSESDGASRPHAPSASREGAGRQ